GRIQSQFAGQSQEKSWLCFVLGDARSANVDAKARSATVRRAACAAKPGMDMPRPALVAPGGVLTEIGREDAWTRRRVDTKTRRREAQTCRAGALRSPA